MPAAWRWGEKKPTRAKEADDATGVACERATLAPAADAKQSPALPEDEASVQAASAEELVLAAPAPPPLQTPVGMHGLDLDMSREGRREDGFGDKWKDNGEAGEALEVTSEEEDQSVQSPVKVLIARWDQASA